MKSPNSVQQIEHGEDSHRGKDHGFDQIKRNHNPVQPAGGRWIASGRAANLYFPKFTGQPDP